MGYTSLENIFERYFEFLHIHKWDMHWVDNSIPWELDVFCEKLNQYQEALAKKTQN